MVRKKKKTPIKKQKNYKENKIKDRKNYKKLIKDLVEKKSVSLVIGILLFFFFFFFLYKQLIHKNKNILKTPYLPNLIKKVTPTPKTKEKEKKYQIYIVQEGDSLSSIAQKFYGDLYLWPKILEANNLSNPDLIEVGMELKIPR